MSKARPTHPPALPRSPAPEPPAGAGQEQGCSVWSREALGPGRGPFAVNYTLSQNSHQRHLLIGVGSSGARPPPPCPGSCRSPSPSRKWAQVLKSQSQAQGSGLAGPGWERGCRLRAEEGSAGKRGGQAETLRRDAETDQRGGESILEERLWVFSWGRGRRRTDRAGGVAE